MIKTAIYLVLFATIAIRVAFIAGIRAFAIAFVVPFLEFSDYRADVKCHCCSNYYIYYYCLHVCFWLE